MQKCDHQNFISPYFILHRAPELLYGSRNYTEAVDLWSVGCIFGELINRTPGKKESIFKRPFLFNLK